MTTGLLLVLDLVAGVLATAAWLGAGVTAGARRPRPALALVGAAALVTWRVAAPGGPLPGMRAGVAATLAVGLVGVGLAVRPATPTAPRPAATTTGTRLPSPCCAAPLRRPLAARCVGSR